ncbi:MAG TPA: hypothetical protein VGO50_02575 [Pyrinomonadaceae bacterium]|jgi:hypothetical protein|nr:hypothetical protein [Pyrinomonadaceae bacterium]
MSAPRLANIPFEHIEAELGAFPIASEASFRNGITSLNPATSKDDNLWRGAERYILQNLPSVTPDEAITLRDKLWFNSSNGNETDTGPVPLVSYVRRLAADYLDPYGIPVSPSYTFQTEMSAPEARLRWSWLCRALPPDFLRTVRGVVDPDSHHFPLHPVMQKMLQDKGFAETHLHLGAALDFSLAWASLMYQFTRSESSHRDFESVGADFRQGKRLGLWLLYSCIVRLILAEYVFDKSSRNESASFSTFVKDIYLSRPDSRLDIVEQVRFQSITSQFKQGKLPGERSPVGPEERMGKRFARARALYNKLNRQSNIFLSRNSEKNLLRATYKPENRCDIYLNDPLARITGWRETERNSPETLFVEKALKYLEQCDSDKDFALLFWQMIRIRCLVYRHVVQRPLTPGLQWFVRFFSRIKPLRKNISEKILIHTAAHICGKELGLRSLEVRLGTEASVTECLAKVQKVESINHSRERSDRWQPKKLLSKDEVETLIKENSKYPRMEVGALFHFSRKRGGGWEKGKLNAYGLDHSYPGRPKNKKLGKDAGNPIGFRFARFYMEQRQHAQALVNLFQKYPMSLRTVRGFDLCTDEAGVPIWVMAPLIRWVKDASHQAIQQLKRRGEFDIPPTRLSIHAGEDFVYLLTGLRRLDEAITYLNLQEGDRLGHALALGIDPSSWCKRAGRVIVSSEERLFDLIWEWSCYARQNIPVSSERLAYVRTEMVHIAKIIFDDLISPEELMDFVYNLYDEKRLKGEGYPDRPRFETNESKEKSSTDRKLLGKYLTDDMVWRRGRIPQTIDFSQKHEEGALQELQKGMRHKVGSRCLAIEVNPSSNLLIGDLGNFIEHPLWRLRPLIPEDSVSPLSLTIGSDDPLTFATTLPHEYQLLFDAMILKGCSHEEAMRWLDNAREAGMESRFTLPVKNIRPEKLRINLLGWPRPVSPP